PAEAAAAPAGTGSYACFLNGLGVREESSDSSRAMYLSGPDPRCIWRSSRERPLEQGERMEAVGMPQSPRPDPARGRRVLAVATAVVVAGQLAAGPALDAGPTPARVSAGAPR